MENIKGYINRIIYRNENNGYTVMSVDDDITCVGVFAFVSEGEYVSLEGEYVEHLSYGLQFKVENCKVIKPEDENGILRYLASGAIKGVKISTATKIVKKFGNDTFDIIENEPERLAEIKGISEKKAMDIASQVREKKNMRDAMVFLSEYGISMNLAVKIYNEYGEKLYTIIKTNPYKMADDIKGVGFKIADEIAKKCGLEPDSEFRIKSGILYKLNELLTNGNIYVPYEELKMEVEKLLGIDSVIEYDKNISELEFERKIIIKVIKKKENNDDNSNGNSSNNSVEQDEDDVIRHVYISQAFYTERYVASKLLELNVTAPVDEDAVKEKIEAIEEEENISLDEKQKQAVVESIRSGLVVITGGPGTGKTTTIKTIINFFESEHLKVRLAAPTGRAAKRMQEATGREAQTIHRLLEVNNLSDDTDSAALFERNEDNPLEEDLIIIDEMSMVDIYLMSALLKAIFVGTRVVLVGDINQLPSVGPGNVLKDIIKSNKFNVVKLEKIFRQENTSDIILDAHRINKGEKVDLDKKSKDFLFIKRQTKEEVASAMLDLIRRHLPKYVNADINEIQVLTPSKIGPLGVENLNKIFQRYLNPESDKKKEKKIGEVLFREGDKVMQIKNNYQIDWEIRNRYGVVVENGKGVFNGDVGIIKSINNYTEYIEVEFDDKRCVMYTFKEMEEVELAYAITIHKSQGSEYPAIIIPMINFPRMLMTRNLLYTAVTRAKKCVCLVGMPEVFEYMKNNNSEFVRYSSLDKRINEMYEETRDR